jgi:4-hydroxyproline epimerase
MQRLRYIDSHTEGEPTRVLYTGLPDLGSGSVRERAQRFAREHDALRRGTMLEPRGHDALVGALLIPPSDPRAVCGVVFFNNVGLLNACGHGTMGVAVTLAQLGRLGADPTAQRHWIETPVGLVGITLHSDGRVEIENVPAWREAADVEVKLQLDGREQRVRGDIAWGGNWFFLCEDHRQSLDLGNLERLTSFSWQLRQALKAQGSCGRDGAEIDHIELFGEPVRRDCDARNFVLCPGKAYDRSPCGTGTSAKLACLHARGKLAIGQRWRQESIVGSAFEAWLEEREGALIPHLIGGAFLTAEGELLFDPRDPFRAGIGA